MAGLLLPGSHTGGGPGRPRPTDGAQRLSQPGAGQLAAYRDGGHGASVEVLNVPEQLVGTAQVAADGTATVPVAGLVAGLYILRLGRQTSRFTVRN